MGIGVRSWLGYACRFLLVTFVATLLPASVANAGPLVFEHDENSNPNATGNLWSMLEGGTPSSVPVWVINPALDAAGDEVVYAESGGIYISDIQGQAPTQILTTPNNGNPGGCTGWAAPKWSPDGQSVITENQGHIYRVTKSGDQWTSQLLINWPGSQCNPSFSPDGTKIAFLSTRDAAGHVLDGGGGFSPALFIANADGSNARQLTDPSASEPSYAFSTSFSPNGRLIAFTGFVYPASDSTNYRQVFTIDVNTGATREVTNNSSDAYMPSFLSDGRIVYTTHDSQGNNGQFWSVHADGTSNASLAGPFTTGDYLGPITGPQPAGSVDPAQALLDEYAPELRYDQLEAFYANAAQTITDYPGNRLRDSAGSTIAAQPGSGSTPTLSLGFLQAPPLYPSGHPVSSSDRLVENGSNNGYVTAAQQYELDPNYKDQIYGRVIDEGGGNVWLQYWIWYYYNGAFGQGTGALIPAFGNHEGDWEMVQFHLSSGVPDYVVYDQHDYSEACDWAHVEKNNVGAPVVYVALNSHASYYSTGVKPLAPNTAIADSVQGNGLRVRPGVNLISNVPPGWINWPGVWGNSDSSPTGPAQHTVQWSQPDVWLAESTRFCTSEPTGTAAARPVAPTIQSRSSGNSAIVTYAVGRGSAQQAKPAAILIAVDPKGRPTPITKMFRVKGRRGTIRLPLPKGRGPYTVRASTFSKLGGRSRDVRAPLGAASASRR